MEASGYPINRAASSGVVFAERPNPIRGQSRGKKYSGDFSWSIAQTTGARDGWDGCGRG
ncbi:hypothetical protein P4V39_01665 [Brevibacillus borstelensis]|nr:hypothetical protein [Brevibacillus borstelensis]MED2006823.1 hypothetical protein [Brevibacillus borstelensis]